MRLYIVFRLHLGQQVSILIEQRLTALNLTRCDAQIEIAGKSLDELGLTVIVFENFFERCLQGIESLERFCANT